MNGIDNLLEKYFNGLSSAEEEERIKHYFAGSAVLPEHEMYRPLFAVFNSEKQIKAPLILLPEKGKKTLSLTRRIIVFVTGVAAISLLAITLFPIIPKQVQNTEYVVIINGKKIVNQHKARQHAETMFGEAKKIIEDSYQPFCEAVNIKEELNAEKILREAEQNIEQIKTNYPQ